MKKPQRKTNRRPSKKKKAVASRKWWSLLLKLAVVGLLALLAVLVYMDAVVQEKFSGKRWTIPARVYARPLELYVGQKLRRDDFLAELEALGYQRERAASRAGTLSVNGQMIEVFTRGFQFYEGDEPAQRLRVGFAGNSVASLADASGKGLALVRLDPLLIGGIYPSHNEDRILVRLEQVPKLLTDTLIAVEDRDFYNHYGVSLKSIARALWVNTSSGRLQQGGSTLTQQLVKNFFLTNERSLSRKVNEALMSLLLELHYDKGEILEAYLNEVFLGQDGQRAVHGFGLASQYYFGQPLHELQPHQIALLVGIVKGPSYYSPRRQPERALARRNLVLDLMLDQGLLTNEQLVAAKAQPLAVNKQGSLTNTTYPAFMDLVRRQLREDYHDEDLTEEGLRIFTSFDVVLQRKAEDAVAQAFKQLGARKGIDEVEAAMVVTDPQTGEVQALLGSKTPRFAGFNRALDAVRPIGSLVKPAIYLTALQQPDRYTLTSYLQDEAFSVKDKKGELWSPQNYDRTEHGTIFLYQGLASSYNLSTARLGLELGVPKVMQTLHQLGMERDWPAYPSMLLGAGSLSPFEVTRMYQTLANGGYNSPLRAIRNVLSADGQPLGRYPLRVEQRFDEGAIYLTQEALRRAMTEGTGRSAYNRIGRNIRLAGKTGTSNDMRDSWFAGYGQDLLAVAWMGRDDNGQTSLTGATGSLLAWSIFMEKAEPRSLATQLPENIVNVQIEPSEGWAIPEQCQAVDTVVTMPYIVGSEPLPLESCLEAAPIQETQKTGGVKNWLKRWLN